MITIIIIFNVSMVATIPILLIISIIRLPDPLTLV